MKEEIDNVIIDRLNLSITYNMKDGTQKVTYFKDLDELENYIYKSQQFL